MENAVPKGRGKGRAEDAPVENAVRKGRGKGRAAEHAVAKGRGRGGRRPVVQDAPVENAVPKLVVVLCEPLRKRAWMARMLASLGARSAALPRSDA